MSRERYVDNILYNSEYTDTFLIEMRTERKDQKVQEMRRLLAWNYLVKKEKQKEQNTVENGAYLAEETAIESGIEEPPFWTIKNQAEMTGQISFSLREKQLKGMEQKKNYIRSLLKNDNYELGFVSELQTYIEEQLIKEKEDGQRTNIQKALEEIYLEEFNHTPTFIHLLQIISQIDYTLILPTGPIMALAATRHENCEVREYGLRCFENWEDPSSLSILKSLHFEENWLQNYLDMLIDDLETV